MAVVAAQEEAEAAADAADKNIRCVNINIGKNVSLSVVNSQFFAYEY